MRLQKPNSSICGVCTTLTKYCSPAWSPHNKGDIYLIENVQRAYCFDCITVSAFKTNLTKIDFSQYFKSKL
jgi:hypothetical protein